MFSLMSSGGRSGRGPGGPGSGSTRVAVGLDRPAQEALAEVRFAVVPGALPALEGG
jgi:hypothetical protein